ncbi:hypothetical protein [Methylobacterium nodulans]|uniref:Secreted protein n=1 Tax=Methylobacterium nodulans (strain LMG 21967 / CNCM I-2342 / ORS 2060) TaxID=460265 RepID=B8IR10_METNO|nr:hypothetical protein [Methylobacterium nodulans]ACL56712.1 conserved hypothetical protein [Methylobacterium nodulans ORS 2060]
MSISTRNRLPGPVAALALLALPLPALANGTGCGGDAVSSAQVTEGRPARAGPLTAVPDTLCADLSGTKRSRLRIDVYAPAPGGSDGTPDGVTSSGTPYDEGPSRGAPRRRGDRSR